MKSPSTKMISGKTIALDRRRADDLEFCREAFGTEKEDLGWFAERNRVY